MSDALIDWHRAVAEVGVLHELVWDDRPGGDSLLFARWEIAGHPHPQHEIARAITNTSAIIRVHAPSSRVGMQPSYLVHWYRIGEYVYHWLPCVDWLNVAAIANATRHVATAAAVPLSIANDWSQNVAHARSLVPTLLTWDQVKSSF